jgi:hypothetical protein
VLEETRIDEVRHRLDPAVRAVLFGDRPGLETARGSVVRERGLDLLGELLAGSAEPDDASVRLVEAPRCGRRLGELVGAIIEDRQRRRDCVHLMDDVEELYRELLDSADGR